MIGENFGLTEKEFINGYHKQRDVFPLVHIGQEVFPIFPLLLYLRHVVKGMGSIGIFICDFHSDINDGVYLALPQMTDLKIPPEAFSVI